MTESQTTTELVLKLELPEKTLRKLKSYAMLSGRTAADLEQELIGQVQPQLATYFDQVLTDGIAEKLGEMDGVKISVGDVPVTATPSENTDHALSADDDEGENLSLEEQVVPDKKPARRPKATAAEEVSFEIDVPDAGDDAEQFLEATLAADNSTRKKETGAVMGPYGMQRAASTAFQKPRVKISEHTGNEASAF